jgi:sulfatase maturation enzyme AslB (radical SAM superfamily)
MWDNGVSAMAEDKSLYCMLFLTRRCNIDCSYCHMEHHGYEDISRERLTRAIDLFTDADPNVCLHLFGGEPLLRFDHIEWIVDYVAKKNPERQGVKFMITTNGLLLRGRYLDFLLENRVEIMLSLDGTFDSQKDWRRTIGGDARKTYDRILENIAELNRRGAQYFVNMVVSPSNVEQMAENVLHFKNIGVRRLQVTYELGAHWCEPYRSAYVKNFRYVIEKYNRVDGFRLQYGPGSEPVLGNMTFIVDVNGDMYRGCAVVLEKTMPRFNEVVSMPNLDAHHDLHGYVRTREEQVRDFLRRTRVADNDYKLLKSNMHLGYLLRREMFAMQERERELRERERRASDAHQAQ